MCVSEKVKCYTITLHIWSVSTIPILTLRIITLHIVTLHVPTVELCRSYTKLVMLTFFCCLIVKSKIISAEHLPRVGNAPRILGLWDVLVLLNFGEFSRERKETWSLGTIDNDV